MILLFGINYNVQKGLCFNVKIIVGLGNPGKEYEKTRHNIGYRVIDILAEKLNISVDKAKFKGVIGSKGIGNSKIILVKPTTFMNLSGDCVVELLKYYKANSKDLIVLYDDIDIDVGKIRVKPSGSPGTHNGMKDITNKIGTKEFIRVRVGTGKPKHEEDLATYVLSNFYKEEVDLVKSSCEMASNAVLEIINSGVEKAMNMFN